MAAKSEALSFEENMAAIKRISDELERGELPLEQAIQKYEEGIKLAEKASKQLNRAAGKITQLEKKYGEITETQFNRDADLNSVEVDL